MVDLRSGVGVHLALATSEGDVDEAASVCESLLRAALTVVHRKNVHRLANFGLLERYGEYMDGTYGVFFFSCFSTLGV